MPIRTRGCVVVDAADSAVPAASQATAPQRRSVTRSRLTCLYGGVFMLAGTALLAVVHLLAVQAVVRGNDPVLELRSGTGIVLAPADCPQPPPGGPAGCPAFAREQPQDALVSSTALVLVALVPLSIAAGYVTAGYALSPLRRIAHGARRASHQAR